MRLIIATAKFWLGLWMLFWGLNWFAGFVPQPLGGANSHELHLALMNSGLFSLAKLLEIVLGVSLLTNRFVPLALLLGAPVTFIVAWVHLLDGPGAPGYFVVFAHIFLLIVYLPYYLSFMIYRSEPMLDLQAVRSHRF